jgi:glycerol-1-phosphate dehydrogenase [NAD(P)+]
MSSEYDPCNLDRLRRQVARALGNHAAEAIRIRDIVIDNDALPRLLAIVDQFLPHNGRLALVWDDRSMWRRQEPLKPTIALALSDRISKPHIIELSRDLHADIPTASSVAEHLDRQSVLVAVGSGNLTDTGKHACYLFEQRTGHRVPLVCWPTANSVNAYSSSLAALVVDGVKRTVPSRSPDAIVCDLPTLASAPPAMQRAGLGDMMARCVAQGDWRLANRLGMDDSYSEGAYEILSDLEPSLLSGANAIGRRTIEGTRTLAQALTLSGLVLSAADQTAPLSGWEHVISHYLDLAGLATGRPLALHGAQVGVASIVSAQAYEQLLTEGQPESLPIDRVFKDAEEVKSQIDRHFVPLDPEGVRRAELWRDASNKLAIWNQKKESWREFCAAWRAGAIQSELSKIVRTPQVVRDALVAARAPTTFEELDPPIDDDLALAAIRHAHLIRQRFTLGDLLSVCDLWPSVSPPK